jgi:hypothetical protein
MQLKSLAKKPELIEVVLDDEETVKEFGESIVFYTWDRVPIGVFTKLAGANQSNSNEMIEVVRDLILDEQGHAIISKDEMLPSTVLIKSISKIVEKLGN